MSQTSRPTQLPSVEHLVLRREGFVLYIEFARPEVRNALNFAMVDELVAVFEAVAEDRSVRAIVLRGQGGHFCAGGDIKDMAAARAANPGGDGKDPMATANRRFGTMVERIDAAPQAVIVIAEGAVMGGGFGLLCVSDIAIAVEGATLRLPETSLGIPPAQIAPFIVRRIGLTAARRFAVTGGRLDAHQAVNAGLAHEYAEDAAEAEVMLLKILADVQRCAPGAIATTKALMLAVPDEKLGTILDRGADAFALAARSGEGVAGMTAFLQKKKPAWATDETN